MSINHHLSHLQFWIGYGSGHSGRVLSGWVSFPGLPTLVGLQQMIVVVAEGSPVCKPDCLTELTGEVILGPQDMHMMIDDSVRVLSVR